MSDETTNASATSMPADAGTAPTDDKSVSPTEVVSDDADVEVEDTSAQDAAYVAHDAAKQAAHRKVEREALAAHRAIEDGAVPLKTCVVEIVHGSVVLHDDHCEQIGGTKPVGGAYLPGAILAMTESEAAKLLAGRSPVAKLADRPKPPVD
jgi:hypothetical protein